MFASGLARMCRPTIPQLSPEQRKDNFSEVIPYGFTEEQAVEEASRCLECGCHDYYECKLIDFANQYDVKPERFAGDVNKVEFEDDHPFIVRDPNKCILCGLCVRVCEEVVGVGALGLVNRGFDTVVKPNMEKPLCESGCISCGQCVSVCPTGALQERTTMIKETPLPTEETDTICSYCSVGCSLKLETYSDMLIKANPDKEGAVNKGLICGKGKWGFDCSMLEDKLEEPLVKEAGHFREADYHEAFVLVAKRAQTIGAKYGKDAIAVSISDRYTNEEAYAMMCMAETMGARVLCMNNRESGLAKVTGLDASPNTIDELLSTNFILKVGFIDEESRVIALKMRQAEEAGAQVMSVCGCGGVCEEDACDLTTLKGIAKAIVESGKAKKVAGYDEFVASLEGVVVSEQAQAIADAYLAAKKAMIVYQQNVVSVDAATLIADIAMLSGHIGAPRDGILQVKPKNNSQGLIDMGITAGKEALEGVKALIVFGENAEIDTTGLEFLAVCDTHMTELAAKADVVLPGTGFASTDGTYTNTERRLQLVQAAIDEDVLFNNWEIAAEVAHIFEVDLDWDGTDDISDEMADYVDAYKYAQLGEVLGGVLAPTEDAKLVVVGNGKLKDILPTTDSLMQVITDRLPKPANPTA